jgi:hypothetical protein
MRKYRRMALLLLVAVSSLLVLTTCDLWVSIFGADPNTILQWMPSGISQGTKEAFKISGTDAYYGSISGTTTLTFGLINKTSSVISMKFTTTAGWLWPSGTYYWNASSSKKAIFWSTSDIINDTADTIMLQTPVKAAGNWVTPAFGSSSDWSFEIQSTKQKVDVSAGSYSDVVIATATNSNYIDTLTFYWSVKQGLIKLEDSYTYQGTQYSIITELSGVTAP